MTHDSTVGYNLTVQAPISEVWLRSAVMICSGIAIPIRTVVKRKAVTMLGVPYCNLIHGIDVTIMFSFCFMFG